MIKRALAFTILASALFGLSSCSEVEGSGELVSIPSVSFTCNSANCLSPGPNRQYRIIYSQFDCTGAGQVSFYAKRSSSGVNLFCNGAGCSASASGWVDENGLSTTEIPAGNYDVCVVVFTHGTLVSGPTSQDAWGETGTFSVSEGTVVPSFTFYDGAAPLF